MTEEVKPNGVRHIVGSFEISLQLTQQRSFKSTGYVYDDDTRTEVSKRIDTFQDQADRQQVRCDIVSKEAQIASHLQNMDQIRWVYKELVDVRNSGKKLSSTQQAQLANVEPSLARAKESIESLQAAIAAAKQKLAET